MQARSQSQLEALTAPFELGPPATSAPASVLLLHGFTGSPWEVRPLGESLADRGFHVLAPRLPGHGTTPEAMLWASHHDWLFAAQKAFEQLAGSRRVVLAGLSMGALLSMILASRRRQRVDGLVLMAPVLGFHDRSARLARRIRSFGVRDLVPPWVDKEGTDIEDDAIRAESPALMRYPMARAWDLMELQDLARSIIPRLTVPSLVLTARNDHVVDNEKVYALTKTLPFCQHVELQRGYHIIPRDTDRAIALTHIAHFVEGVAA